MKKSEVFVFASAHGRWRALPVHVAKVLVAAPRVQHLDRLTYLRVFRGEGGRIGRGGGHFCAVRSSVALTARQLSCRGRRPRSDATVLVGLAVLVV
eukprot:scaffold54527_cov69-Phaeocystis_antarctica.AAC.2